MINAHRFAKFLDRMRDELFGITSKILSLINKQYLYQNSKFMLLSREMEKSDVFIEGKSFLGKNAHQGEKRGSQCFQKSGGHGLGWGTWLHVQGSRLSTIGCVLSHVLQFSISDLCQRLLGDESPPNHIYSWRLDFSETLFSFGFCVITSLGSLATSQNIFDLPPGFLCCLPLNLLMFLRILPLVFIIICSIFSS